MSWTMLPTKGVNGERDYIKRAGVFTMMVSVYPNETRWIIDNAPAPCDEPTPVANGRVSHGDGRIAGTTTAVTLAMRDCETAMTAHFDSLKLGAVNA